MINSIGLTPLGRSRRRVSAFSPLDLSPVLWLDFSDTSTLFTDSSGTIPVTADGDVIGRASDLSGNGNHATQGTTLNKPVWRSDGDGDRVYFDRSNDSLAVTSLAAGTYTVGAATWSASQIYTHKQNSTGSFSLNPADFYELVVIPGTLSSGNEALLLAYLEERRALQGAVDVSTDLFRVWSSITSVSLAFTESADAGGVWAAGDGQTGTGTSFVKTLAAAPDWVTLGATTPSRITIINWSSKSLFGQFMDISNLTALTQFFGHFNQLTGSIPDLSNNTALIQFYCYANQLTGSIPDLSNNTALIQFYCYANQLTGSIPDLSNNTALTFFLCYSNQLTDYAGGSVSITLGNFQAQNNQLTEAAVDAILAAFVAANKTTGTRVLNLGGTGNATPSATGLTDKATLQSRGWTVTTN